MSDIPLEHIEQRNFVQWFRRQYPDVLILAIPNGGSRSMSQGAKLKLEGVVKGIPDLFVPAWNLWIEMKRIKGGIISNEQKKIKEYLISCDYSVLIATGCENATKQVKEFADGK